MDIIQDAFQRIFPDKEFNYKTELEYNRRLSPFNANITASWNKIKVNMNLEWKNIDKEIKIGLIQHLLFKIFKKKDRSSPNIILYNSFIKQIPTIIEKTESDPILEETFQRNNQQFFGGGMQQPNLTWGKKAFRRLASYNFHNDTITVSTAFKNAGPEVLGLLVYHEMLHKHHQFEAKNGRSSYHSPAFKRDERMYPNFKEVEQQIAQIIRGKKGQEKPKKKKRSLFDFW